MIVWLLRNRYLYQVHSYVTLLPLADLSASTTVDSVTHSDMSVADSSADAAGSCIVAATGTDAASPQSVIPGDVDASVSNGLTSDGRRISLDAKDRAVSSKFFWSHHMLAVHRCTVCLSVSQP